MGKDPIPRDDTLGIVTSDAMCYTDRVQIIRPNYILK
jgi:hypothetical protein